MSVFLGNHGNVRLRRGLRTPYALLEDQIKPDDVNTTLNRLSFDSAVDNLITGDRIDISTRTHADWCALRRLHGHQPL
jgi:hypothetical protein